MCTRQTFSCCMRLSSNISVFVAREGASFLFQCSRTTLPRAHSRHTIRIIKIEIRKMNDLSGSPPRFPAAIKTTTTGARPATGGVHLYNLVAFFNHVVANRLIFLGGTIPLLHLENRNPSYDELDRGLLYSTHSEKTR